jgi:hypothetical protein
MAVHGGPKVNPDGLVLSFDSANYKSFKGEETTNLSRNSRDFSGTAYASSDEWVSSEPTRLAKTYISSIITPIGTGATLIQESGTAGYHHLSRYGGGDENGLHSLSCYVYPLTNDITDFCIGMLADGINNIRFNLNTRAITYGDGISNRNAFITPVIGYDGWYKVGANIEGRPGGWVGCFGYSSYTSYTGTSGAKKCYITGIQYESKSSPTSFTEAQTTRGSTVVAGGGWKDLTGKGSNGELVNGVRENSDNLGSLIFDGMDDYVSCGALPGAFSSFTIITWFYPTVVINYNNVLDCNSGYYSSGNVGPRLEMNSSGNLAWAYSNNAGNNDQFYFHNVVSSGLTANTWHCAAITYNGGTNTSTTYYNGNATGLSRNAYGSPTGFIGTFNNLNIGRGFFNSRYFQGRISQTQIYNRELTLSEVRENFNAIKGRFAV